MLNGVNDDYSNLNTRLEKNMLKMILKIVNKISQVYLQEWLKPSSEIHLTTARSECIIEEDIHQTKKHKSEAKLLPSGGSKYMEFVALWVTSLEILLPVKKGVGRRLLSENRPKHHS